MGHRSLKHKGQGLFRTAIIAVMLSAVLAGCAGNGGLAEEGVAAPDVSAEAAAGGTMRMLMTVPARSFDPADDSTSSSTGDATRMSAVYDFLFYLDPTNGEVKPRIGKSLTSNAKGTVWTMKINPGITFSDGTEYDAEAVKFTYEHIRDKGIAASLARMITAWKMTVVDPLTLEIKSPIANTQLDRTIADSLPFIISPSAYKKDPEKYPEHPIGAGPFLLKKWVQDDHEIYEANPGYWQEGLPKLDELRLDVVQDGSQRVNTIGSGDADMQAPSSDGDMALLDNARSQNLKVVSSSQNGGGWIYFNNARPPFNDSRAREAMYLAIDRKQLAQVALGSVDAEAVSTLFVDGTPFFENDLTFPQTDKAKAQEIFNELAQEGKPVEFTYVNVAGAVNSRTAQILQSQLSEFENVTITIDTLDLTAARERVFMSKDFDMSPYPGAYKFPDPEPGLYNLLVTGGSFNTTAYSNSTMDAALNAGRATTDTEERAVQYRIVQEQFMKDLPGLFTFKPSLETVIAEKVTGLTFNSRGIVIWDKLGFKN